MKIMLSIIMFLLGASFGSFLSVVIDRIKRNKKGIVFGHSECPLCKKRLTFSDLIPIFSYIFLRGRCRHCGKKISPLYFILELTSGLIFLALFLQYDFVTSSYYGFIDWKILLTFKAYAIISLLFIAIFFYDLQTKKIPEIFLYILIIVAVLSDALFIFISGEQNLISILIALVIAGAFFGGQYLFSKGKWLGDGDVLLAFAMAIMFGWQKFLIAVVAAYLVGALIAVPVVLFKKAKLKTAIPFAPFLITGSFITLFFGNDILTWYLNTLI